MRDVGGGGHVTAMLDAHLWQATLDHSPVGTALLGLDGSIVAVNEALCQLVGRDQTQMRSVSLSEVVHAEDREDGVRLLDEIRQGKRSSYRMRTRYLHADGHTVWGDVSVAVVRDQSGGPQHLIAHVVDVTRQQLYESRLAEASSLIDRQRRIADALLDSVDIGLALIDREGHYERQNGRLRQLLALGFPEGHDGRAGQVGQVFAADGVTRLTRDQMPSMRAISGEEFDDYVIWAGADPMTRRALSVSSRIAHDAAGGFAGAAVAYKDITDLIRAMRIRDDLVTTVSHELRTPLASVLGHLEILAEANGVPESVRRQVSIVERNAARLQRLVDDIVQVAQGAEGLVLHREPVDLAALVQCAVDDFHQAAEAAGVGLDAQVPASLIGEVDGPRVRQLLDHLLDNAVKYARHGGIVLHLGLDNDDQVALACVDSGVGMGAQDAEQALSRFWRGQDAQLRHIPGTGLGLSVVQQIAAAHGGEVELSSELGHGTAVRVRLPHVVPTEGPSIT